MILPMLFILHVDPNGKVWSDPRESYFRNPGHGTFSHGKWRKKRWFTDEQWWFSRQIVSLPEGIRFYTWGDVLSLHPDGCMASGTRIAAVALYFSKPSSSKRFLMKYSTAWGRKDQERSTGNWWNGYGHNWEAITNNIYRYIIWYDMIWFYMIWYDIIIYYV